MFDDRKIRILYYIIDTYISDGQPVGSKFLAKEYNLDISPATIRNDMLSLEKMGLLQKAHTSSGRLPSDRGYRIYVNDLLEKSKKDYIKSGKKDDFTSFNPDKNSENRKDVIRNATKLLADSTGCTAVSITVNKNTKSIVKFELIRLTQKQLILICVFDNGMILDERIYTNEDTDEALIINVNHIMTKYKNDIGLLNEKLKMFIKDNNLKLNLTAKLEKMYMSLKRREKEGHIIIEGLSNIFNFKEFYDITYASRLIKFFDNPKNIERLFDEKSDKLQVKIGDENFSKELKHSTFITGYFDYDTNFYGRIGIIGPTRMQYDKVIADIKKISLLLGK